MNTTERSRRMRAALRELDSRAAADSEYRMQMSTASKSKGHFRSWRAKFIAAIVREEKTGEQK